MLQLILTCPCFLNLVDGGTKYTGSLTHMSKDICQVTGVLIVEVWAVVPEVFLPCLSYQMGVLAKHLLMASHQHFVKSCYLPLLQTGGPLGSCLGHSLAERWDVHQIWWVMSSLGPGWGPRCRRGRSSEGGSLLGGGCSLGDVEKMRCQCVY